MPERRPAIRVKGDELRQWRLSLGWSQEFAAAKSGYTDRLIRKLERGGPVHPLTFQNVVQAYSEASPATEIFTAESLIIGEAEHDLESLARQWLDGVYNQRDRTLVDTLMSPDVVLIAEGATRQGREVVRQRVESVLAAFDPLNLTVERLYVEKETVIAYWRVRKRHIGDFLGIAPTRRWVQLRGSSMAVFRSGQIVEVRDHWDVQDLVQQLTGNASRPV